MVRRRCAAALAAVAAAAVAGCGSEDFPNDPRPPAPVQLSAVVNQGKVTVAPRKTGAGLATITISNQSSDDLSLDFSGPSKASTSEISAGGVGTLQVKLDQGNYKVAASAGSISNGTLKVGPERPSAQNQLLLP